MNIAGTIYLIGSIIGAILILLFIAACYIMQDSKIDKDFKKLEDKLDENDQDAHNTFFDMANYRAKISYGKETE